MSSVSFSKNISISQVRAMRRNWIWHNLWKLLTVSLKDKYFHNSFLQNRQCLIFKWISHYAWGKFSDLQYSDYRKMHLKLNKFLPFLIVCIRVSTLLSLKNTLLLFIAKPPLTSANCSSHTVYIGFSWTPLSKNLIFLWAPIIPEFSILTPSHLFLPLNCKYFRF